MQELNLQKSPYPINHDDETQVLDLTKNVNM